MNISMWILADWLKEYNPSTKICEGNRIIQNVRLFSDNLSISRSTVYLNKLEDNHIICSNGHDIIILNSDDIDQILNDILNAFDYYNEWSNTMYDLINHNCSVKDLLIASEPIMKRYLILGDATYYVYEHCGPLTLLENNVVVANILKERLMPLETLLKINRNNQIRLPGINTYLIDFPEFNVKAAVKNLFVNDHHKGWLITLKNDTNFTKGEFDLQDELGNIIESWMKKNQHIENKLEQVSVFLDLLNEKYHKKDKICQRLESFNWYINDLKQIYVFKQNDTSEKPKFAIDKHLEQICKDSFFMYYKDDLLLIINHSLTDLYSFENKLQNILKTSGCILGKSPVFTDIMHMKANYKAAKIAVNYVSDNSKLIYDFKDAIIPYCISTIKDYSITEIKHPALNILKNYDREHNTKLYETLCVFIKYERNYTLTTEKLFIHRSTLLYRISRILELTGINLDIYEIRLHLLLSFHIDNIIQP